MVENVFFVVKMLLYLCS